MLDGPQNQRIRYVREIYDLQYHLLSLYSCNIPKNILTRVQFDGISRKCQNQWFI